MAGRATLTQAQVLRKLGVRSGLEKALSEQLDKKGVRYGYESFRIPFLVQEERKYTPDYLLLDNGIIVEGKGRFDTSDRKKHRLIKEQHPDLDIRFVFSRSATRISKQSKTTYAAWCEHQGIQYADKVIPEAWLQESPNRRSLDAVARLVAASQVRKKK